MINKSYMYNKIYSLLINMYIHGHITQNDIYIKLDKIELMNNKECATYYKNLKKKFELVY